MSDSMHHPSRGAAVVLRGDARCLPLPDASVDLICTSPPYFGLRSYTDDGEHYDGQIGSEATPGEWLAALLECTREWVRVLKPEGSLFVNIGDSYSNGQPAGQPDVNGRGERTKRPTGGRQMCREDAAWLAGVIDSDGSISIRINKQPEGRSPSFVPWVRIGQTRPEVIQKVSAVTGIGQVMEDGRGVWNWCAAAQQARWVLARIYPWLTIKRRQAAAAIEVARHVEERNARSTYRPLTHEDVAYRQRLKDAAINWNHSQPDDLVPPEPVPVPLPIYPMAPAAKSLHGLPWQYANACVGDLGLILRRDIVWHKLNSLPESVTDRCRSSHEYLFHLVKQPRYYAAVDEIREPHAEVSIKRAMPHRAQPGRRDAEVYQGQPSQTLSRDQMINSLGKLPGSVWDIPSQPLTVPARLGVDHFAAFPMELPRRIILGWSPPGICTACGEGRRPVTVADLGRKERLTPAYTDAGVNGSGRHGKGASTLGSRGPSATITGYACACPDATAPTRPALIVDPFGGTGTTALVAAMLGRDGLSFDLSADYCRLARWRTTDPAERAKALGVPKPPPVINGQGDLFEAVG